MSGPRGVVAGGSPRRGARPAGRAGPGEASVVPEGGCGLRSREALAEQRRCWRLPGKVCALMSLRDCASGPGVYSLWATQLQPF